MEGNRLIEASSESDTYVNSRSSNSNVQKDDTMETIDRSKVEHTTSNFLTFMSLIKGNIGTGILALPAAMLSAGLWAGFVGIFVLGAICIYCMHLLVQSNHSLCKRYKTVALDYGDVMQVAFQTGPRRFRFLAVASRLSVNFFLIVTQVGTCSVFIIFIASNIRQVVPHEYINKIDLRIYMVMIFVLLAPYVLIRQLKYISMFATGANSLILISLVIILQYTVQDLPPISSRPYYNSTSSYFIFISTAIYAYEGIGSLLPIENKMATPEDLGGWNGLLNMAMTVAMCGYATIAFYGYLRFGEKIKGSITLNLPQDNWLYLSVNIIYSIVIFLTFALTFYVPLTFIWPWFQERFRITRYKRLSESAIRLTLLTITAALAVCVPHIDLLISLVGAIASSFLAIIFPPLLDLLVRAGDGRLSITRIVVDVVLFIIGVLSCILGTVVTIQAIANEYSK